MSSYAGFPLVCAQSMRAQTQLSVSLSHKRGDGGICGGIRWAECAFFLSGQTSVGGLKLLVLQAEFEDAASDREGGFRTFAPGANYDQQSAKADLRGSTSSRAGTYRAIRAAMQSGSSAKRPTNFPLNGSKSRKVLAMALSQRNGSQS